MDRNKLKKYSDIAVLFFLGLHVISSQWSVAASSIGLGGMIITGVIRLIYGDTFKPDKTLVILFLILIFFHLFSSVFSVNPEESFLLSRRVFLYFTFFAVIIFIRGEKDIRMILMALMIFTFIISVIEIFSYIEYIKRLSSVPLSEIRLQEFGFPVTNGQIKMLLIILFTSLLFTKKSFDIPKIYIIILLIPLILTLYFTNARSAFLGTFGGLIVLGVFKNRYFLAGLIIIIGLFLLFAPAQYKQRILSIADLDHPSNHSRIVMWETGIKIIGDYPLTGIGDTDLKPVYEKYKTIQYHGEASHMHNNIMQLAVQMGIPGLLSWLFLMIYLFYRLLKKVIKNKSNDSIHILFLISLASLIAFQISGLTEYNFGDFEFTAVLWFCLGLGFAAEKFKDLKSDPL